MYDLFGGRFVLSISRFVKMVTDPRGLIFLGLSAFLLFATDPNNLRTALGEPLALLAWTGSVMFYLCTLLVILSTFSFFTVRVGPFFIYTPVTSSLGLLIVYVTVQACIGYFTDESYRNPIYPLFFNLMGAGIVIETLFVRFVMPSIFPEPTPASTPAPSDLDLLRIADRQIPVSKVLHIMSQEHYLQVTLANDTLLLRGRLADVVAQTTESQGIQPHRSWWVSASAQPRLEKNDGKSMLKLVDETLIPVAKARASDVQRWLDLHSDW